MRTVQRVLCLLLLCLLLTGCQAQTSRAPTYAEMVLPTDDGAVPVDLPCAVDDDWFSDTAMIGHSLMHGMQLYSGLETPDYYTLTGGSVSQLLSGSEVTLPGGGTGALADALEGKDYRRFYLFMGINEIANPMDNLRRDYERLVDLVLNNAPEAEVYVLAVLPVTREKASGGVFTLERILDYNEMLQGVCDSYGCYYVDLYECFAGEDGYLPSSASTDGVHLTQSQYPVLLDYLKTHTAQ